MSVYYVHAPDLGTLKIGYADSPISRLSKMQSDSPTRLILLAVEDGGKILEAERHAQFAALRRRGEWFAYEAALVDFVATLAPAPARIKVDSLNKQLIGIGLSPSYSSMIVSGKQAPPVNLAVHIYRVTGWKHDRIAALSESDMLVFERHDPWSHPRSAAA